MGFFDKIKSAASAVTGGGATVTVQVPQVVRGQSADVAVQATAKKDLEISGVYLEIRCREEADVRDTDFDEKGGIDREIVRGRKTTWSTKVDIAGGQKLQEGEATSWEGTFTVPPSSAPSLRGQMVRVKWEVRAGLDAWGNDPDSGWREVEVH